MPFPPPPAAGLISSGTPISAAPASSAASSSPGAARPGTTGTPRAATVSRAVILSPMVAIAAADGPTKAMPAAAQATASSARSERKP